MSTTRRTLLKLLSALPFAGVVMRAKHTDETGIDFDDALVYDDMAWEIRRPILARLEEWYDCGRYHWGEPLPTRIRLTRAEIEEFEWAYWREVKKLRPDRPMGDGFHWFRGIPIVEAERSDLP